jgi:hypothetical protein
MDGFCVSLPVFFIRCCCWLYTLLFLLFPSLSHATHSNFLGMAVYACGWVGGDGLWNGNGGGLLAAGFRGAVDLLPGQFSDGTEFRRKGISTFGGSTNPSVNSLH